MALRIFTLVHPLGPLASLATLVVGVALFGCETLKPPEITAEGVSTAKITEQGGEIEATLSVYNPNRNALTANGIDSKVTIGGKANVARAVVVDLLILPGQQRTKLKMPVRVEWSDRAALTSLAEAKAPADYVVEGIVHFAGKSGALQTPFQIKGTMSADELGQAVGIKPEGSCVREHLSRVEEVRRRY